MGSRSEDRPRLRPLEVIPIEKDGGLVYCLRDPSGESGEILVVTEGAMAVLGRLDGTRDLDDIQLELCRAGGEIVPRSTLEELIGRLEEVSFLDSPAYRERRRREIEAFDRASVREAVFAGTSYASEPAALGAWIEAVLEKERPALDRPPRGLVVPHIDPQRGAAVYGSAYSRLRGSTCRRIVILGISHRGGRLPYATIDKDFATPFGPCPVDRRFLDELHAGIPFDPLAERSLHRREHSIEFQTIFLRHILERWDERRIVPILCCFPWLPPGEEQRLPYPESWRIGFARRLAELIDEQTVVVAGVDFAHVGRRFGDAGGNITNRCEEIERADRGMMQAIAEADLASFRGLIDQARDERRICGYPALVTLLEILPGCRGEVIDYGQAVDEATDSLVSFGAIGLGEPEGR